MQEDRLDRHFSKWYDIITATKAQQREGLDRMFIDGSGREVSVEYKADFRAHSTGNFYVETVSRGNYSEDGEWIVEKDGWIYTSTARVMAYLVVATGELIMLELSSMRERLQDWVRLNKYRSVTVRNFGYQGRGLLVPLGEIRGIALGVEENIGE